MRKYKKICTDCGKLYMGGKLALFCPACKVEHNRICSRLRWRNKYAKLYKRARKKANKDPLPTIPEGWKVEFTKTGNFYEWKAQKPHPERGTVTLTSGRRFLALKDAQNDYLRAIGR